MDQKLNPHEETLKDYISIYYRHSYKSDHPENTQGCIFVSANSALNSYLDLCTLFWCEILNCSFPFIHTWSTPLSWERTSSPCPKTDRCHLRAYKEIRRFSPDHYLTLVEGQLNRPSTFAYWTRQSTHYNNLFMSWNSCLGLCFSIMKIWVQGKCREETFHR